MTVAEMGRRMTAREWAEWMAMESIEPVTRLRDDVHHALATCQQHNLVARRARKPTDFLPFAVRSATMSKQQQAAVLDSFLTHYTTAHKS